MYYLLCRDEFHPTIGLDFRTPEKQRQEHSSKHRWDLGQDVVRCLRTKARGLHGCEGASPCHMHIWAKARGRGANSDRTEVALDHYNRPWYKILAKPTNTQAINMFHRETHETHGEFLKRFFLCGSSSSYQFYRFFVGIINKFRFFFMLLIRLLSDIIFIPASKLYKDTIYVLKFFLGLKWAFVNVTWHFGHLSPFKKMLLKSIPMTLSVL